MHQLMHAANLEALGGEIAEAASASDVGCDAG
jgi:hypothetical protein